MPAKIRVEMFGSGWLQGPVAEFDTITAGRQWAESFGSTADTAVIRRGTKVVGYHYRDVTGSGLSWCPGYREAIVIRCRYRWAAPRYRRRWSAT